MDERMIGYVIWWNDSIGYGRVRATDGREVHIHHKQFLERAGMRITCRENQCLSFVVGADRSTVPPRVRAEQIAFETEEDTDVA